MSQKITPEISLDSKLQNTKNEDVDQDKIGPSDWVIRNILNYSSSLLVVKTGTGDVISMVMN